MESRVGMGVYCDVKAMVEDCAELCPDASPDTVPCFSNVWRVTSNHERANHHTHLYARLFSNV